MLQEQNAVLRRVVVELVKKKYPEWFRHGRA